MFISRLFRTAALSAAVLAVLSFGGTAAEAQTADLSKPVWNEDPDFPPLFDFLISYDGANNATSVAQFLDAPAGNGGFLRCENGHFVNDKGRVRLHATNLTGPANFPTHEESDKLARRLARFGINCVRLHYFDAGYGTFKFPAIPGIFKGTSAWNDGPELPEFDPERRDRQDYMIAAFKKQGIYVNMNLHVAREPKGLDIFSTKLINLQKEYAKALLTHVNPYTGNAYVDEPAIAVIEINNENALWAMYRGGSCDNMRAEYKDELQAKWNAWLKKKYASTDEIRKAWNWEATPLTDEQIADGQFDSTVKFDQKTWYFLKGGAQTTAEATDGAMKIRVEKEGGQFFPKFYREVNVQKDKLYTLSFKIRQTAGKPGAELGLAVADERTSWTSLGAHQTFKVGKDWKPMTVVFCAADDCPTALVQITRFPVGEYEIDDLSFQSGAAVAYALTGSLDDSTVPLIPLKGFAVLAARRDFAQFLCDTESAYWHDGIYNYVKNELKAKQVISGTQLGYTPAKIMAELDYIDSHSYWQHPSVCNDWRIGNNSMINSMGCITGLANQRVDGMPYTVSEYNHPFPNLYGAEGQPLLRAYGALQDWDGVFEYTYNHCPDFEPKSLTYFFSMICRTDVLAHFPACAAMFLRGDVQPAKEAVIVGYDDEKFMKGLAASNAVWYSIGSTGVNGLTSLVHRVGVNLNSQDGATGETVEKIDGKIIASDTGELVWNREISGKCFWTVKSPNTKLFCGFPEGRTADLGNGVALAVGKTRLNWATVSMVSLNATGFGSDGAARILLTATAYSGNKGQKIERPSDSSIYLSNWGEGGVEVEGVPGTLTLPAKAEQVKCFALDPAGERKTEVPVSVDANGQASIQIDPKYQTIWYEIVIQ